MMTRPWRSEKWLAIHAPALGAARDQAAVVDRQRGRPHEPLRGAVHAPATTMSTEAGSIVVAMRTTT